MTNKEKTNRDIELTFNFVRFLINNPKFAEFLPDKCEIDFIERDFSTLTEKELSAKNLVKVNHTFDIISPKKTTRSRNRKPTSSKAA